MSEMDNIEEAIETIRQDLLTILKSHNGIYVIDLSFYAGMLDDLKRDYRIAQSKQGWDD